MIIENVIFVVISLRFEGFHCWPTAPQEHSYLAHPHRHVFHVKASAQVGHTDREVEIIKLKRDVDEWIAKTFGRPAALGARSCEDIAIAIGNQFDFYAVEVTEDGENGAMVIRKAVQP